MGKKIVIVTGSPRMGGNTTALSTAFTAGAVAAGHEVQIFNAATAKMDGCHGDCSCHERGSCGLKDDFQELFALMNSCDVLVMACPVYWGGFTSQMKRVIDRFNCYNAPKGRSQCTIKEAYLLAAAKNPDAEAAFAAMNLEFDHVCNKLDFKIAGKLLVPGLAGADEAGSDIEILTRATVLGFNV